jgi:hypothetical protein
MGYYYHHIILVADDSSNVNVNSACNDCLDITSDISNGQQTYQIQIVESIYNKSNGNLGSDGSGGSINGELSTAAIKTISKALDLNSGDHFCDIGSGGGFTLMRFVALSKCKVRVGIEIESERHNIAMNFIKKIMETYPDIEIPVAFANDTIMNFTHLSGISKLFMYDAAFTEELLIAIGLIVNKTESIKYIASTKDLRELGFNVVLYKKLGSLSGRGNMTHTFYIFKSQNYKYKFNYINNLTTADNNMKTLFETAVNKEQRYEAASTYMYSIHNSEKSQREQLVRNILNEQPTVKR